LSNNCQSIKRWLTKFCIVLIPTMLAFILTGPLSGCANITNETSLTESEQNNIPKIVAMNPGDTTNYWNTDWSGRSADLFSEMTLLTTNYARNHDYIFGVNDCNDMVIELWQNLKENGILSLITVGNLEKSNESFIECNHAWLLVYSGEGSAAAIDTISASVYLWEQVSSNPQIKQYWEGFLYDNPSNLLIDFKERW